MREIFGVHAMIAGDTIWVYVWIFAKFFCRVESGTHDASWAS